MAEKNRTFEVNVQGERPLKLKPRPKPEERMDSAKTPQDLQKPLPRRAVVERLIEWFKQD